MMKINALVSTRYTHLKFHTYINTKDFPAQCNVYVWVDEQLINISRVKI